MIYNDPDGNFGIVGGLLAAGFDVALQAGLMAVGAQDEFDYASVGGSFVGGVVGVGLGNIAAKAGKFKKQLN